MGFFSPSEKKIRKAIEKDISLAMAVLSNAVGTNKFNKCKQENPGVIYGFFYGVATHTWEVIHHHTKPDWQGYGTMFNIVDDILNIDRDGYEDWQMVGWNYQQGLYHNKDFGSLEKVVSEINISS
jgi:hypothetical protein